MKKNLISVVILALMLVNIIVSSVTMFSVTSTNQKTAAVINKISSMVDLQVTESAPTSSTQESVSLEKTDVYNIADTMTIPLKVGKDGKQHYYVINVSLSMNKDDKDYKTYSAEVASKESLIKSQIINVVSSYSLDEIQADQEGMKKAVLASIQKMFNSKFIFQISFSNVLFQ
jgi:flagellar FliL protein